MALLCEMPHVTKIKFQNACRVNFKRYPRILFYDCACSTSYGLHDFSLMVARFYLQNELHIASRSLRLRGPRPFLNSRRVLPCSRRHRLLHCHAQQVQDKMATINVDMKVGLSEANTIDVYTSKTDSAKSAGSASQRRSGSVFHLCRSVWTF